MLIDPSCHEDLHYLCFRPYSAVVPCDCWCHYRDDGAGENA